MINWLGERYCATKRLKAGLQVKVTTLSLLKNLTVFSNCCSMLTSIKLRVQILVGGGASLFQVFMFTTPFEIVYFFRSHLVVLKQLKSLSFSSCLDCIVLKIKLA